MQPASSFASPCAMQGEVLTDDALLRKLRDSRHRFQRRMQQLIEKYDQPFADAPLVRMSTLTYETPQGLRIWGGGLIKERNKGQIQDSSVKRVSRKDSPVQAPARGAEQLCTQDLGVDSSHTDVDATLYQEDLVAGALMPAVPWSPLKNELRRKYLTQVDILLQDDSCLERTDYRDGKDTRMTLTPSLASPARPAQGHCGGGSGESPRGPAKPASSMGEFIPSHPCSTDLAIVPRSDSLSSQRPSGDSFSSSQSFEADICSVTLSDLYAGMLHSMSRLLSVKPSCIISTKTSIVQNWHSRRRHRVKSRMNKTYCRGGRRSQRSSQDSLALCSEPVKEVEALRDCKNLLDAFGRNTGLKLGKAFPEANKRQIHKVDPSWKELKEAPQTLTYVDFSAVHHLDQENRYLALKWLISPVKLVSRPRILPGRGGNHREMELRFDKLHREYCLSPRKQPPLPYRPCSSAVDVCRGGPASPGGPQGFETYRPSRPSIRAKAKRLNEALENLGTRAPAVGGHLAKRGSSPLLSETDPAQGLGHSERIADLFQGNNLEIFRKSVSPKKAVLVPRSQTVGIRRDRYGEIKEKFDKLHQKYCQKSLDMKVPLCTGASLDKASVVQYQKEDFLRKLNLHSGICKLPSSPQQSTERSLGSHTHTVEVHPSPCVALAASRGHQYPAKRCRLSDPQVYGQLANSPDSLCVLGRALPRPGEETGFLQRNWEEKRKEQPIFQNGRGK